MIHLKDLPAAVRRRVTGEQPRPRRLLSASAAPVVSELEEEFAGLWRMLAGACPPPLRQWKFYAGRRWKFDFAWPLLLLAVEIDGGTHNGGRHVRAGGFQRDREKDRAAIRLGWRVLHYTAADLKQRGAQVIEEVVAHVRQAQAG